MSPAGLFGVGRPAGPAARRVWPQVAAPALLDSVVHPQGPADRDGGVPVPWAVSVWVIDLPRDLLWACCSCGWAVESYVRHEDEDRSGVLRRAWTTHTDRDHATPDGPPRLSAVAGSAAHLFVDVDGALTVFVR